jgi:hypothetical protein
MCKNIFPRHWKHSAGTRPNHNHKPQDEDKWNNTKDLELDPAKEIIQKSRVMKNVKLTEMLGRLPGSKETFPLSPP